MLFRSKLWFDYIWYAGMALLVLLVMIIFCMKVREWCPKQTNGQCCWTCWFFPCACCRPDLQDASEDIDLEERGRSRSRPVTPMASRRHSVAYLGERERTVEDYRSLSASRVRLNDDREYNPDIPTFRLARQSQSRNPIYEQPRVPPKRG